LKAGRYPNCQQLAKELEMTAKTVQRDINFMRDELNLPLAYDEQRHGYFYEKPVGDFPLLQLSRRELVTLFLARQALSTVRGTRLEQELAQTFERLTAGLSDEVSFSWSELDAAFSVRATGVVEADARLFGTLSDAILQGREVAFTYRKLTGDVAEPRRVRPYHLGQVDHGWYLFGFDLDRGAVSTFALPRIADLMVTTTAFERPADFSLRNHLGGSFGVWNYPETETGDQEVRVVFRGYAARVVAERRWHPSQEIAPRDGEESAIELRLRLRGLEEVARWILSWGRWAEVLEPEELRQRLLEEVAVIADRGGPAGGNRQP
jgi:proteasome accessory factor B